MHKWTELTPHQLIAMKGFGGDRGVFVRMDMLRALQGDCNAAVLLSQYIYWSQSEAAAENDGWFYLTTQKVNQELGMSAKVQRRIRQDLVDLGILEFERRGNDAKNYYRLNFTKILEMVTDGYYPKGTEDSDQRAPTYVTKGHHIVNREVRTVGKDKVITAARRGAKKDFSVLGEKFDDFLAWVVANYPVNGNGLPATEHQARRIAKKLGDVKEDADAEAIRVAKENIQEFIKAVKNIKAEVDAGSYETKYVPKFDNFAGLGVAYGKEAAYKAWAKKVVVEKKRGLVV